MDIIIQQLPLAGAITGAESVPVDQDDITVKTTTGDLTSQGVRNTSTITLPFAMYGSNYMGKPFFGLLGVNKFVALTTTTQPTNYLNWEFIGGSVNGINIATDNPLVGSSITLTPETVTFVDEGRGLVPNQYTDFVNSIMEGLNLVSRVETTEYATIPTDPPNGNNAPYWNQMNYCNSDTYFLLFKETGELQEGGGTTDMAYYYGFKSYEGLGGFNVYGSAVPNPFGNTLQNSIYLWDRGNDSSPFVQQY